MRAWMIAGALVAAGAAWGQDGGDVEERARELERSRSQPAPVWPEGYEGDRTLPGSLDASRPAGYGRLREGAYIRDRRGRLGTLAEQPVIVFDDDASGMAPEPLRLLPCLSLMEMERLAESREGGTTFDVSGQVFEHRGRMYLMPMRFSVVASEPAPAPEPETPGASVAADDAESVMRSLEAAAPVRRAPAARAPAEPEDAAALLREGEFLNLRRGRMERSGATSWTFVFDNDADTAALADAPLDLLPCRTLERMERIVERLGERTALTVSGEVYVYEGRNHLLPTLVLVDYPGPDDIASAQ